MIVVATVFGGVTVVPTTVPLPSGGFTVVASSFGNTGVVFAVVGVAFGVVGDALVVVCVTFVVPWVVPLVVAGVALIVAGAAVVSAGGAVFAALFRSECILRKSIRNTRDRMQNRLKLEHNSEYKRAHSVGYPVLA